MILTGNEIAAARERGEIIIDPFDEECVNPNSYNFRLSADLLTYKKFPLDPHHCPETVRIAIPETGFVLQPGRLYLGCTIEEMGSNFYAPTFAARSSVARMGLFINLSANLGDIGYVGRWTLQLVTTHPIKLYPGMRIGQMMWWVPKGRVERYQGKYQGSSKPTASLIHRDF